MVTVTVKYNDIYLINLLSIKQSKLYLLLNWRLSTEIMSADVTFAPVKNCRDRFWVAVMPASEGGKRGA
jgi:hypothetical protein